MLDSFFDPSSNFLFGRYILDPSRYFCHWQIINSISTDSFLSRFSAQQICQSIELWFLFKGWAQNQIHSLPFSLDRKLSSLPPNSSHSLKSSLPLHFRPISSLDYLVRVLIPSFFMHSCILDLGFGVFQNFLGCVVLIWWYMIMHCISLVL